MWANNIPRLRIADYGTLEGCLFGQMLPDLQRLLQIKLFDWIIVIVHEELFQEADTNKIYEQPVGPSRAQGRQMAKEFSECWRSVVVGNKYIWRTRPHGRFATARSRLHLPDNMEATFQELSKHLPASMKHLL
jgi:hypothetical protein